MQRPFFSTTLAALAALATTALAFPMAAPAQEPLHRNGLPITPPDLPMKSRTYGLLDGRPTARIASPGKILIEFTTAEPVPPPTVYYGINTLDEELDYPRFRSSMRAPGAPDALATEHAIEVDFTRVIEYLLNTECEPRVCWRVEVYLPSRGTSRFFEGRVYFDPETLGDTVNIETGPFVEQVTPTSAIFTWETDREADARVIIMGPGNPAIAALPAGTRHAVRVDGLLPGTAYTYRVASGETTTREYGFRTAGGDRFAFAAMVDSREGTGGGMLNFGGVEGQALLQLGSDLYYRGADFIVFAGDLINGYTTGVDDFRNQLQAFRQMMAPIHARIPIYESMGNHEALLDNYDDGSRYGVSLDKQGDESAEAIFKEFFHNPSNGPADEGPGTPTYDGNVYFFDHGNARFLVLNNNYWWSSNPHEFGGNLEGFILPNQLAWLREQVAAADADPAIQHLFAAAQEPPFPNGGHTGDAMWWRGGDTNRDGQVDARDVPIVENRNEMWSILAASPKTVAFITGDEHAYSRLMLDETTDVGHMRLPDGGEATFAHPVWQVTSGGAGAPRYDKELDLPWSPQLRAHSTQPHYAFFRVDGGDVTLEVFSQTGQRIDSVVLRRDGVNLTGEIPLP